MSERLTPAAPGRQVCSETNVPAAPAPGEKATGRIPQRAARRPRLIHRQERGGRGGAELSPRQSGRTGQHRPGRAASSPLQGAAFLPLPPRSLSLLHTQRRHLGASKILLSENQPKFMKKEKEKKSPTVYLTDLRLA